MEESCRDLLVLLCAFSKLTCELRSSECRERVGPERRGQGKEGEGGDVEDKRRGGLTFILPFW